METSNLRRVLASGHFAVTGEIGPPKSCNADFVRKKAKILLGSVDAANITDNQTAIVRMSSIAGAVLTEGEGLEAIVQMTCRDRNRIGLQSDILGMAALGIKNVVCLTGDHQSFGNHPEAKNVFDMDSIQLIHTVRQMRDEGKFVCGEEMKVRPDVFIGCVENPFADPFPFRAVRLKKKVMAGAEFCQTQCVLDMERFRDFMKMVTDQGIDKRCYILAGIMPLKSARMARYMASSVAGMSVSEDIIRRLDAAEDAGAEAIRIAVEQIEEMREIPGVAGVHLMPVAWEDIIPVVVQGAGLLPRP